MKKSMSGIAAAILVACLGLAAVACSGSSEATEHYNRANQLLDQEKWEDAISELDQAIELDPGFASAYVNRGNAHFRLEHYEQAIADYDRAIELDPGSAYAYANRGSARAALGQMALAKADYEQALPLASDPALVAQINEGLKYVRAVPKACRDARAAFHDWLDASAAAADAGREVISDSIELNVQVGKGVSKNIRALADAINAGQKAALQLSDKAARLWDAYRPLFDSCLTSFAELPQACADEMGQYPDLTTARGQIVKAQARMLRASRALTDAETKGTKAEVNAAVDEVAAAGDEVDASVDSWNNVVLPSFNSAVEGCNAALSTP